MRGGSPIDRFKQGVSRDLRRVAHMIGPAGPKVLQRISDAGSGGLAGLRGASWHILHRGLTRGEWIAIGALLVSLVSAFYTYKKVDLTSQSLKQHLEPELTCLLGNRGDQYPLFSLVNEGQIDAESVSVDHLTFRYTKEGPRSARLSGGFHLSIGGRPGFRWLYSPKLAPSIGASKQTGEFVPPPPENENEIAVLFFDVSYLRPTDGKLYQKRCVYYKDGDQFERRVDFQSNPYFKAVDEAVDHQLSKILDPRRVHGQELRQ